VNITPITLEGTWARLEPLGEQHVDDLVVAADENDIWTWMPIRLKTADEIRSWKAAAHADQERGYAMPFAIIDRATGKAVGSTRYMDIQPVNRGLEIGWTWLAKQVRRTLVNTECKYLLLSHAFDAQDAIRVQLKTNAKNERSRAAILRIGAQFEGILRQQMILPNGDYRDSAYYSIIDTEWPAVKTRLEGILAGEPSAVTAG
jgi:RimJ/RimL family protein N-acetyltransferase